MEVGYKPIKLMIDGNKQFLVPLFQREFCWVDNNIDTLWEDIEISLETNREHFIGSIVTMQRHSLATDVATYLIIDGQQRLTTIFILLSALRDRIKQFDPKHQDVGILENQYITNSVHPDKKYKIIPTQKDREAFCSIVDDSDEFEDDSLLIKAYMNFRYKLSEIKELKQLLVLKDTILGNIKFVDILLGKDDNPYLIFESLNATGVPLSQVDLITNYVFMSIVDKEKQKNTYQKIWFPLKEKLGEKTEEFIRYYLAMITEQLPNKRDVYTDFRKNFDFTDEKDDNVIKTIKQLDKFSNYYLKFILPENETNEKIRNILQKISRLNITIIYPFLLKVYDNYKSKKISLDDLVNCLKIIEVYFVRRAVCGSSTKALSRYIPTIYSDLNLTDIVNSLKKILREERTTRFLPKDDDFKKCIKEAKIYGSTICRYLLIEIENHKNKEPIDYEKLTIEHIMPQTLTDEWEQMLGSDFELISQKYGDVLGNLTLTGYNAEYSNKPFIEKRDMEGGFKDSGLKLNRDIAKLDSWGKDEIIKRTEKLAKLAVKIWPL